MPHWANLSRCKDSELNSKFKIINSKSNNALVHAPLCYCIATHAHTFIFYAEIY